MGPLSVVWWMSSLGGVLAVLVAVLDDGRRRGALFVAAALFTVAGMLGILSIGVAFLAAAVACGALGVRAGGDGGHPADA